MMAYKAFVGSKIEYGNLICWRAAEGSLEKLDRVHQSSAVLMLENSSAFFIPSLESRRQAAAVGLTCKLLDGQGRGALSEVQPVFAPPTTKSTRSSDRLAAQRAAAPSSTEGCCNPPHREQALTDDVQKELQSKNPRDMEQPRS